MRLTDVNGRKWVLVPTDGHWDMTKAALALIKSTGVNPGDLTVGRLAAAIENAIAAAPEFEGSIPERVEQEPVAWVLFDDIFIALKDMQDDPPNLECMKPLYAHPLALREPTDDECREIADRFLCEVANAARGVRTGRAMFNAVREVMTK